MCEGMFHGCLFPLFRTESGVFFKARAMGNELCPEAISLSLACSLGWSVCLFSGVIIMS